jgi:uncharacterized protein (TIGR01244 family)
MSPAFAGSGRFGVAVKVATLALMLLTWSVLAQDEGVRADVGLTLDLEGLPHEVRGFEGEIRGLWRDGRVYIGGQPDEAALARFAELGVTVVVNLRTRAEMEDRDRVPFDEAGVVEALGLEYVHIPLGSEEHPYTPEAVALFADVLERHGGRVLLHCTVAWRASYLWSAYLITEHGLDLDRAMARGEAMAIDDLPIEGLLGRPIELVYSDADR